MSAVRWASVALRDYRNIIEWVNERNPTAALRITERIEGRIEALTTLPMLGRPGRVEGTRELVVSGTPYIVVYQVAEESGAIMIVRVLHSSQRWPPKSA